MAAMKRWKLSLVALFVFSVFGILYFSYFINNKGAGRKKQAVPHDSISSYNNNQYRSSFSKNIFSKNILNKDYDLDLENQDVIVYLHIQKTGGTTFGKHLVENLDVDFPCNCYNRTKIHCDCLNKDRKVWLFSRYSTGWKCGVHADWTELKECVDDWFQTNEGEKKRRYYYITLLREPVGRFISEWLHVQRGATWKTALLQCNGRQATIQEVPFCFFGEDWKGVTLKEFLACKHNLAINRQTRMLANLSKVNCYNTTGMTQSERDRLMLQSAKDNLVDMAFFGLSEFQNYTQFLFEHTLNINFRKDFEQYKSTHTSRHEIDKADEEQVVKLNYLDIELYKFAKDLFFQRIKQSYLEEGFPVPWELREEGDRIDNLKRTINVDPNEHQTHRTEDEDDFEEGHAFESKVVNQEFAGLDHAANRSGDFIRSGYKDINTEDDR